MVLVCVVAAFFWFDLGEVISVSLFRERFASHPVATALTFFVVYVAATAFSLPVGAVLSIIGGMTFGLVIGTGLVSFASTIGATLAFLFSRFILKDWVQQKLGAYLQPINRGMAKDGAFYLFTLRLIPVFPFLVINLLTGLTPIRTWTYYWVSQLAMFPATVVYVYAGAELGEVEEFSTAGILQPGLIFALVILAMFPFIARGIVAAINRQRVYRGYQRPKQFDTNVLVIGAGSAGLVSAYIAAAVKAHVTLVEKHRMGGDCLNTGCVPSKTLIRAANTVHDIQQADQLGINTGPVEVDFPKVMARVREVISQIEPNDSVERYGSLGVTCVAGTANIVSPWEVEVDGRRVAARSLIIATGASPAVPNIPGLEDIDYLTSDTVWQLDTLPKNLLVIGTGPIGCELAQAFQRLGSKVTLAGRAPCLLPREDEEVSEYMMQTFAREGLRVLCGHNLQSFEQELASNSLPVNTAVFESVGQQQRIPFDRVLLALGRKPNTQGFGLEGLGIALADNGTIEVDEYLRTKYPNIYACGDVVGPYQFTHAAAHQAWYAAVNALFGRFKKFKVDYSVIPWATFTAPEVARVGLNEQQARAQGVEYEITRYDLSDLDRALTDNVASGFVKVLTVPGKDKILGATIVGHHGSELLSEFITAMKRNLGLNKILGTIHIYPTMSEANKYVAGNWKREHTPEKLLSWVEKYHRWMRNQKT
ncbi:MAG: FAD-dependent oxidoreductase [Porticoccaceae bacterium]|nr:FAD-dependent oxidoreductase [Porticoccaceae bacterium]